MGLIDVMSSEATPARRTAKIAEEAAKLKDDYFGDRLTSGTSYLLYHNLSTLMCWQSAMFCAWVVNGIHYPQLSLARISFPVSKDNYGRLFSNNDLAHNQVNSMKEMMSLPVGCFVGFINTQTNELRHVMIHIHRGMGAGNKNDCVYLEGQAYGWELLDMTEFFNKSVKVTASNGYLLGQRATTKVVFARITGQNI